MTDIKGNTIYARKADLKVVEAFNLGKTGERKVSVRDRVFTHSDGSANYALWNTYLVKRFTDGKVWIYITDNSDMDDVYYRNYGRQKEVAMTQTTKNRLNVFLSYYGFECLEVHSSKKLFGVWHKGKELENNTWYELDFLCHELVKAD